MAAKALQGGLFTPDDIVATGDACPAGLPLDAPVFTRCVSRAPRAAKPSSLVLQETLRLQLTHPCFLEGATPQVTLCACLHPAQLPRVAEVEHGLNIPPSAYT